MIRRMQLRLPDLVTIPGGSFVHGSTAAQIVAAAAQFGLPDDAFQDELPQQMLTFATFAISRAPITCAEYQQFVVATDHTPPAYWPDDPPEALRDHPVVGVSRDDARAFCRWLSTATQRALRLPSEAEWECAARGTDQRVFPWGDEWQADGCNTTEAGRGGTVAVGSFAHDRSQSGCVDMAGNVAEWTSDRYQPYPGGTVATPARAVARGGHWAAGAELARSTRRQPSDGAANAYTGFRIVCDDDE